MSEVMSVNPRNFSLTSVITLSITGVFTFVLGMFAFVAGFFASNLFTAAIFAIFGICGITSGMIVMCLAELFNKIRKEISL